MREFVTNIRVGHFYSPDRRGTVRLPLTFSRASRSMRTRMSALPASRIHSGCFVSNPLAHFIRVLQQFLHHLRRQRRLHHRCILSINSDYQNLKLGSVLTNENIILFFFFRRQRLYQRRPILAQSVVHRSFEGRNLPARIEFLIFKVHDANAAGFGQSFPVATPDLRCRAHRFHPSPRQKRETLVSDVIELLNGFDDVVESVAVCQRPERRGDSQSQRQTSDCELRLHQSYLSLSFFVLLGRTMSRSGTPNEPSSWLRLSRSIGPTDLIIPDSLGSMVTTAS